MSLLETFWNSDVESLQCYCHFSWCLQYPEIFVCLSLTLFLEITRSYSEPSQGFHISNQFLGQKLLLDRELFVSWSIVTVENPIIGPKFRPFSTHITVSFSKYSCITIALIPKRLNLKALDSALFQHFSSVL
jgi:hypothetical protein